MTIQIENSRDKIAEPTKPNWGRRLALAALSIVALLAIVLACAFMFLRSSAGLNFVETQLEAAAPAGQNIQIEGLSGNLFGALQIEKLVLEDAQGSWLNIRNANISWRPGALLKRQLHVDQLEAELISVTRKPILVSDDIAEPSSSPSFLPRAYTLENFGVGELSISRALAPQDTRLTLSGNAKWIEGQGDLVLNGRSLDDAQRDSIYLDLQYNAATLISGTANISSQSDGLIASILGFSAQSETLLVSVQTQGETNALSTNISGIIGDIEFLSAAIESQNAQTATVSARLSPNRIPLLSEYASYFGGDVALDAAITDLSRNPNVLLSTRSPRAKLDMRVIKDGSDWTFDDISLTLLEPHRLLDNPPATADQLSFTGRANANLSDGLDTNLSGQFSAANIVYNTTQIARLSGPLSLLKTGTQLGFDSQLTTLASNSQNPERIIAQGTYNFADGNLNLSNADISAFGVTLKAQGSASVASRTLQLQGTYGVSKTNAFAVLPARLAGDFTARRTLQGTVLNLSGAATDIDALPAPLDQLIRERATYQTIVSLSDDGGIRAERFTASSAGIELSGSGQYPANKQIRANIAYEAEDVTYSGVELLTPNGTLTASGTMDDLTFDAVLLSSEVVVSGGEEETAQRHFADLDLTAKGMRLGETLTAQIVLKGETGQGPAQIETVAELTGTNWALRDLSGELAGLKISGSTSGVGGDISLITSNINLSGDPSLFIPAKSITLNANLQNNNADISAELSELSAGPLRTSTLTFSALGPQDAITLTAELDGDSLIADIERPIELSLNGIASLLPSGQNISANITGHLGRQAFETNTPLTLSRTEAGITASAQMSALGGEVAAEFTKDATQDQFSFNASDMSLVDILAMVGRPALEGTAEFEGNLTYASSLLNGEMSGLLKVLSQPGSVVDPLNTQLEARITNSVLALDARSLSDDLTAQASLGGALNVTSALPYISWPPQTPLTGAAQAQGNVGILTDLFLPPETVFDGDITLNAEYSLPLDAATLNGNFDMQGGTFEQGLVGLKLNEMSVSAVFSGNDVTVSRFEAKGANGGTLSGGGTMDVGFGSGSAVNLTAKNLLVFNRSEGSGSVSGALELTHQDDILTLSGTLNVNEATVNIDKFPKSGRPTLDVKFDSNEDVETVTAPPMQTALNIKLVTYGKITLRGYGVDTNMSMDADITGPFNNLNLSGNATILRGSFNFLSKKFTFETGRIDFADELMDSQLDITAVREADDLTANITVSGILSRPEVELGTDADLPEDEVLSRILFGRSATQLSIIETAQLAGGLAQLSGGGGFDLMGGIQNLTGLDTLNVDQSDAGTAQFTTGKYLSDNVYVEVTSSAEGAPGLSVEWTPRTNVTVEAETSPADTQRLSVQWKNDFDDW